jgi:nucleotide-binding universal stress UspA family protein
MSWALADGPVLCGVDFSDDSRHALRVAAALAARLERALVVVSAIEPLLVEAAALKYGPHRLLDSTQAELTALIAKDIGRPAAEVAIFPGHPAETLLREADSRRAAMIVVGTRGLGRAKRLVFGSTTLRVFRSSDHPVLAVPPADETTAMTHARFNGVICGVDFSDASLTAAAAAMDLGRRLGAEVTLVHAVPSIAVPATWDALAITAPGDRAADAEARLQKIATGFGAKAPSTIARVGDVAAVLTEEAAARAPALIVLGLGGRDGHRPGTHAYRLLTESPAPVLAVPSVKAL